MKKKIAMLFAEGFEEAEAIIVADVLRRLEFHLDLVSISRETQVTGSHDITIKMDAILQDCRSSKYDAVILPGGMPGAASLRDNSNVIEFVQEIYANDGVIAAICAAPIVLAKAGLITENIRFTAYPGFEADFGNCVSTGNLTERSNRIITGKGPGATFAFAAEIASALRRGDEVEELYANMFVKL